VARLAANSQRSQRDGAAIQLSKVQMPNRDNFIIRFPDRI
jgi:hypothetical protein